MKRGWLALPLVLLLQGCSDKAASPPSVIETSTSAATQANTTVVPAITKAVETAAPEATPTPGRSAGPPVARLTDAFPELPDLPRPVSMVELPGEDAYLVALQDGQVIAIADDPGAGEYSVVLEWRERTRRDGNEEGLLGLALDPLFAENGFLYVYYTSAGGERRSVVSRFGTSGQGENRRAIAESESVLLEVPQPYANHNGGHIAFGPDGKLYIGLGDGGSGGDPEGNGQDTGTLLGSILRIDVRGAGGTASYAIPDDNPFAAGGGRPEIWAYGLRNPWRFSFDRETAEVWAGDVGQDRFEEIDVIERGGNYGWNVMEGSHCYRPGEGCALAGLSLPVAEYDHGGGRCSVTGGYVYRGTTNPSLRGYYVFGDFCSGEIWVVDAEERGEVIPLIQSGLLISSFAEDSEGEMYVLSFDGRVYRLIP